MIEIVIFVPCDHTSIPSIAIMYPYDTCVIMSLVIELLHVQTPEMANFMCIMELISRYALQGTAKGE